MHWSEVLFFHPNFCEDGFAKLAHMHKAAVKEWEKAKLQYVIKGIALKNEKIDESKSLTFAERVEIVMFEENFPLFPAGFKFWVESTLGSDTFFGLLRSFVNGQVW